MKLNNHEIVLVSEIRPLKILKLITFIQRIRNTRIGFVKIKYAGCAVCGRRQGLQIHHLSYKDDITMLLCDTCHKRVHFGEGLQHLNPVGKKKWARQTKRLIDMSLIGPITFDPIMNGYIRLLKLIFREKNNMTVKHNQKTNRKYWVVSD